MALADGPVTAWALMDRLYSKTAPWLRRAAEQNVLAHLGKLQAEDRALRRGDHWELAPDP